MLNIVQTTPVIEGTVMYDERYLPDEHATIYGLGDDGKPYLWGRTKSTRINHEPDEEGDTFHYEHEYGWKPYEP